MPWLQVLEDKPSEAVDLLETSLLVKKTTFEAQESAPLVPVSVRARRTSCTACPPLPPFLPPQRCPLPCHAPAVQRRRSQDRGLSHAVRVSGAAPAACPCMHGAARKRARPHQAMPAPAAPCTHQHAAAMPHAHPPACSCSRLATCARSHAARAPCAAPAGTQTCPSTQRLGSPLRLRPPTTWVLQQWPGTHMPVCPRTRTHMPACPRGARLLTRPPHAPPPHARSTRRRTWWPMARCSTPWAWAWAPRRCTTLRWP